MWDCVYADSGATIEGSGPRNVVVSPFWVVRRCSGAEDLRTNVGKIVLCRHLSYGLKYANCLKISTKSLVDSKLLRIFARFCAR